MTFLRSILFFAFVCAPFAILAGVLAGFPFGILFFAAQGVVLVFLSFRIEELWSARLRARFDLPEAVRMPLARVLELRSPAGVLLPAPPVVRFAIFDEPTLSFFLVKAPGRPGLVLMGRGNLYLSSARGVEERIDRSLDEMRKPGRVGASLAAYLIDLALPQGSARGWFELFEKGPAVAASDRKWGGSFPALQPFTALRHALVFPFFHLARASFGRDALPEPATPVERCFTGAPHRGGLELLERRDR